MAFESRGPVRAVLFDGGAEIEARSVVVATGVSYRRLDAAGPDELSGRGVYYGASASEASQCQGDEVYLVGAANSAGQAALNLARYAKRVVLVVRGESLDATMSRYLVERLTASPCVEVRLRTEVVACHGDGHLEGLTLLERHTGRTADVEASWLFVFIGASPRTEWLGDDVARDALGFVVTGQDLHLAAGSSPWPLARQPFARDQRAGRVRRGRRTPGLDEAGRLRRRRGRVSVYLVHRYLATV